MHQRALAAIAFAGIWLVLSPSTGHTAPLFDEDFSDNSAGWTLDAQWQIGSAPLPLPLIWSFRASVYGTWA